MPSLVMLPGLHGQLHLPSPGHLRPRLIPRQAGLKGACGCVQRFPGSDLTGGRKTGPQT